MWLEGEIGYAFQSPALLELALTHRSVSSDNANRANNERLEFLGDAVLQLVVTDYLYANYPDLAEGKLAKVRAAVVSRPALADVARSMSLGHHVELTVAEERTGGRDKDSILADTVEALIGAVYLDGGLDAAGRVVLRLWGNRVDERARQPGLKDYKTRLQEVLAKDGRLPVYVTDGSGPDHARTFVARVSVDGAYLGEGSGRSKREAEQGAAEKAIEALRSRS
ncbi:MAG TPA: ribonuclease III [Acidimicrobiia bacterium]|jgi:ribonuclease-3